MPLIEKFVEMLTSDTHDKLINFITKLINASIQLVLSALIIAYSFQSFIALFDIKEILKNEFYIKFIKTYINIANEVATIGHEICGPLPVFGTLLIFISVVIQLAFEFFKREFNVQTFFIGELLIYISIGLTFWSSVFWAVFWIADDYLKYYMVFLPLVILVPYGFFNGIRYLLLKFLGTEG
ncbi:hypothetical protein KM925_27740 [Priestia megaterium]|uniref:hypothetical protein n=1 Tax=Priestia megaterium TaxID=1404 RepID=UPI001C23A0A4|nr:hypothetical protein [Priestia megaterium]MBU8589682.1 hypothetical protein [Priestia megaterium]